jgi:hypothetical protein
MGPRTRDRGIWLVKISVLRMAKLQRGRDHVIAESRQAIPDYLVTMRLQWGRDHVIAESTRTG